MRIVYVNVNNFRGIRSATLEDLKSLVVIAGANGSGKSCILDAFRLLKSVYGGINPTSTINGLENSRSTFPPIQRALKDS